MIEETIARVLDQKEAERIVVMDMSQSPIITDTFILCTANSKTHMASLRDSVIETLDALGKKPLFYDRGNDYEWLVVDASEIVVHIFTKKGRAFFALEKLWINVNQRDWESDRAIHQTL